MARPKRKTIGDNPLDAVVPRALSRTAAVAEPEEEVPKQAKERITFRLSVEVMERTKNAVHWTSGLTLADLTAQTLTDAVDHLDRKRGEAFRPRKEELKGGSR